MVKILFYFWILTLRDRLWIMLNILNKYRQKVYTFLIFITRIISSCIPSQMLRNSVYYICVCIDKLMFNEKDPLKKKKTHICVYLSIYLIEMILQTQFRSWSQQKGKKIINENTSKIKIMLIQLFLTKYLFSTLEKETNAFL